MDPTRQKTNRTSKEKMNLGNWKINTAWREDTRWRKLLEMKTTKTVRTAGARWRPDSDGSDTNFASGGEIDKSDLPDWRISLNPSISLQQGNNCDKPSKGMFQLQLLWLFRNTKNQHVRFYLYFTITLKVQYFVMAWTRRNFHTAWVMAKLLWLLVRRKTYCQCIEFAITLNFPLSVKSYPFFFLGRIWHTFVWSFYIRISKSLQPAHLRYAR